METIDVVQSAGIRLAKSLRPGYDSLFALLRGLYNTSVYETDQVINLDKQVGAEQYELAANGFPTNYHTVSFAPTNWLARDRAMAYDKVLDRSEHTPLVVGMLAVTEKIVSPELLPGQYTVLYRQAGMPKELTEAIKAGHKEVQAALKAKERGEDPKEVKKEEKKGEKGDKEDGKQGKAGWRDVIGRFGLAEADLEPADAVEKINFVRVKGAAKDNSLVVPVDKNYFLFFDSEGRMVGLTEAGQRPALGPATESTIALAAKQVDGKDASLVTIQFTVPPNTGSEKREATFRLELTVDVKAPSATNKWRMPQQP
jgi:hypothetical protein